MKSLIHNITATSDAASLADGGLLKAVAPNSASVLLDTLTGVIEIIGCAVFLGLALAAALYRVCRHAGLMWKERQARIAQEALHRKAGIG